MRKINFSNFPNEIWRQIFEKIDEQDLAQVSLVSKEFLSITNTLKTRLKITDRILPMLDGVLRRFQDLNSIIICTKSVSSLVDLYRHISRSRSTDEARKRLKILNFRSPTSFLDEMDLVALSCYFPMQEEIIFSNVSFSYKPSRGCKKKLSKLEKLKKIIFNGNCGNLSDEVIVSLSIVSENLEEIRIESRVHYVTENAIGYIMRNNSKLNSLTLYALKKSPENSPFSIENSIVYAKNLHTVCFYEMNISNELICSIARANPPLKKLEIASTKYRIEIDTLSMLFQACCSIEQLYMKDIDLVDNSIDIISPYLTKLIRIDLSYYYGLTNRCFFALINSCPLLEDMNMGWMSLGEGDISHMKLHKHDKIRSLSLCGNYYLDDKMLEIISSVCSNLQVLNISYCQLLTEEGIGKILESCHFLTHLGITKLHVTNIFKNYRENKTVNLKVLRAAYSKMDDEGMREIGRICTDLELLDIGSCCGITNIGIMEVVKNCKKLAEIDLRLCGNVSEDDLNVMMWTRPSLKKIIHCCYFRLGTMFHERPRYLEDYAS